MASQVRYVALVFLLLVSTGGHSAPPDDEQLVNEAVENLNAASRWLIEEGTHVYTRKGYQAVHSKLFNEWVVLLSSVNEYHYRARFVIKTRGIYYDIMNVYREKVGRDYYAFWTVKVTGLDRYGGSNRAEFFVTKTQVSSGIREIVKQSDQFLPRHQVEGGQEVVLPVDDLAILYFLQAWLFPDNYRGVDVNDMKVFIDRKRNIKRCGSDIFSFLTYPCLE